MQFTNLLVLIAAIGATAAPSKELHARTSGIKLSKIAGKWKVGWTGAKTSEQYTCSNNGLLVSTFFPSLLSPGDEFRGRRLTSTPPPEPFELQLCLRP
jgi:hypothetical protein